MTNNDREQELSALIRPLPASVYAIDVSWASLDRQLRSFEEDYGLEINPDFQRGHVWTPDQQRHFVENAYRGIVGPAGLTIRFSAPHWDNDAYNGDLPRQLVVVDGLQRLTAIREFMAGNVRPFGLTLEGLAGTKFDARRASGRWRLRFEVLAIQSRSELLQYYLDLNDGGTPHSAEELARVRAMLATARQGA